MTHALILVGDGVLFAAVAPAILCVLIYARAPWWRTPEGRHLMTATVVIAAILSLSVARVFGGGSLWFAWLRLGVFAGLPVVMTWRALLLVRAQLPHRGSDPPARPQDPQDPHSGRSLP